MTYRDSGQDEIDYYIDFSTGAIKLESDTDETQITSDTRAFHTFSSLTTPNGDTLDNYIVHSVHAEYYNSTTGIWDNSGDSDSVYTTVYSSFGVEAGFYDGENIYVYRGNNSFFTPPAGGSDDSTTGRLTDHPCRVRIVAMRK